MTIISNAFVSLVNEVNEDEDVFANFTNEIRLSVFVFANLSIN